MTTFTMTLPDELAEKAKARGLLTNEGLTALVREALEADRGQATPTPMAVADALAALMRFGDGRRLDGLSLREMAGEGRR